MPSTAKPLTGRKVLLMFIAFFGVIIGVNLTLVFSAIGTFPGLEVKNSYVASQTFNAEKAAQIGLGWTVRTEYVDGLLSLAITDKDGNPANVGTLDATIGRATHANADISLNFAQATSPYSLTLPLDGGKWELRLKATASDGTKFHQRLHLFVGQ